MVALRHPRLDDVEHDIPSAQVSAWEKQGWKRINPPKSNKQSDKK